ncbi:hypothetical protein WOLCODRAFT_149971 [Wolfiporia cocos MD-104 SS10]|uniref:Uncharacterized protein n=1 Tax=Wolfiporia cocos (strain MD-104) TaxID=742152 RepID=A0A2H3JM92_WOLCO|nr:hypothetical protein WOLCODRAFT_149971 [Wolfiporia cocos MD-104 SS10]
MSTSSTRPPTPLDTEMIIGMSASGPGYQGSDHNQKHQDGQYVLRSAFPATSYLALSTDPPVQIGRPGSSFTVPLRSGSGAPQAQVENPTTPGPACYENVLDFRPLFQSPSLGYIPMAFPMAGPPQPGAYNPDPHRVPDSCETSYNSEANARHSSPPQEAQAQAQAQAQAHSQRSSTHRLVSVVPTPPSAPTLPLVPLQTDPSQSNHASMLYLSQLLLEATNASATGPAMPVSPNTSSSYFSALSPSAAGAMVSSFLPSLQSHSTSILGSAGANPHAMRYPPPIAYRTRAADLAALAQRVRASFEKSVRAREGVTEDRGETSSGQDGRSCDTGRVCSPLGSQGEVGNNGCVPESRAGTGSTRLDHGSTGSTQQGDTSASARSAGATSGMAQEQEEDSEDEDEEELRTPTGDIPIFIGDSAQPQDSDKGKGTAHKTNISVASTDE